MVRPEIDIPNSPTDPYPVNVERATVIPGFGRGSADLGFPTANIDITKNEGLQKLDAGVYFGFARLHKALDCELKEDAIVERVNGETTVEMNYGRNLSDADLHILPMVMSLGWNPYYGNKEKTCEIYIIKEFESNFYGAELSLVILGYLRPELDYEGIEALKKDIQLDVDIGLSYLSKPEYSKYKEML